MFQREWSALLIALVLIDCSVTRAESPEGESDGKDPVFSCAYTVKHLPVWSLDAQNKPVVDPSLLISHIKAKVEPATWHREKTGITMAPDGQTLFVSQTASVHSSLGHFLDRLGAFTAVDPAAKLAESLPEATRMRFRILVFVSDPNSTCTDELFAAKRGDAADPTLHRALRNCIVHCATPRQARQLEFWKDAEIESDDSRVAIIGSDGTMIAEADFETFRTGGELDELAFAEFLNEHAEVFPDAETELQSALMKAKQDGKHILVQMSGPNCDPCVLLSELLDQQKELVSKDYVHLKLDTRMENADAINKELVGGVPTIPWMAIVSSDRKVLATSVGPDGNIGYPSNETSKAHFREMLESTATRLTPDDMDALLKAIDEK